MLRQPMSENEATALTEHLNIKRLMAVKEFDFERIECRAGILPESTIEDIAMSNPAYRAEKELRDRLERQRRPPREADEPFTLPNFRRMSHEEMDRRLAPFRAKLAILQAGQNIE